jgi:exosortase/archaeosortase family protein
VAQIGFYRQIQAYIVPWEARIVALVISIFKIKVTATPVSVYITSGNNLFGQNIFISWNCIGWQSFILLFISLITGLQGRYSRISKIECALTAFLGTFLMNIIRISLIVLIAYYWGTLPAIILHDYGSILMTILWLFLFWWFSYTYILVPRTESG